jgi:hypothetical protein
VRYEEWADEAGLLFLPDNEGKERQLATCLVGNANLVWWVEADTWEDAKRAQHEHHGWEPYVPFD